MTIFTEAYILNAICYELDEIMKNEAMCASYIELFAVLFHPLNLNFAHDDDE